jgi:hypothetical protein
MTPNRPDQALIRIFRQIFRFICPSPKEQTRKNQCLGTLRNELSKVSQSVPIRYGHRPFPYFVNFNLTQVPGLVNISF